MRGPGPSADLNGGEETHDLCDAKAGGRGAVEILSLNRPEKLNALSPEMAREITDYSRALRRGPTCGSSSCAARAGISAPAPISGPTLSPNTVGARAASNGDAKTLFRRGSGHASLSAADIALVHGAACGGGLSLALASDVRYASPDARMNAAYIRIGLGGCDMGAGYLLPRLVGLSNASEFLLTGRFIEAERALRMGLISEIVPAEKLLDAGLALAEDMLKTAPMGLRLTKESIPPRSTRRASRRRWPSRIGNR